MLLKPDHCKSCLGWSWGSQGYVPSSGTGENGVVIIAEAAGEHEAKEGMPLVGKAGGYLFSNLQRAGIQREGFRVHNVISCRPPNNKLAGMDYEDEVVNYCAPLLDETISEMHQTCERNGKNLTILTLGRIAFKRIMGFDDKHPIMRNNYLCYPFWSERYQAWVIAADHPSYLMRGNNHLIPVLQFAARRALEIADQGLEFHKPTYLCDPEPATFAQWCQDYLRVGEDHLLSFDIETPMKQGKDEEEVAREDDEDYTILRCSFSYRPGEAISVPWNASYRPYLEELFIAPFPKCGWNNSTYDEPRIKVQMPIRGDSLDGMLMWHVLNSALPKGLGFVTPFYAQDMPVWKYTSNTDPARYNCQDADAALRNVMGIKKDLIANKQWHVFEKHVVELNRVLSYMSERGVIKDEALRSEAETKLQGLLDEVEERIEAAVPQEARKLKVYKKTPADTTGMVQVEKLVKVKRCSICGMMKPPKTHFKPVSARKRKLGLDNVCEDAHIIEREELLKFWAKPLEFKVSVKGLSSYQKALKHQAIINRKENRVTFDESAIVRLMKQYPKDPLYPAILEHREIQKLLSTYVGILGPDGRIRGGMPVGRDGRIHTTFTHNPSTLRLASQSPNLQNLPRPGEEGDLQSIIRNLVVAGDGCIFSARDYSGIEAVLVGYFASYPEYIRLAKIDVHSFYTAYALYELEKGRRVSANDLPLLSWSDEKLIPHLAALKKEFKAERNSLYKHLVHAANFMQTPRGAREKIFKETRIEYPQKMVTDVMDVYFSIFPGVRKWHSSVLLQAEKDGFLRNPFGYVHRFGRVFRYEKLGGKWGKKPGEDANKVAAFLPQSTAAGIIKSAMLRLFFQRFEESGQYLSLQVHDELLSEVPEERVDQEDQVKKEEMERSIPELKLPTSYGMGEFLTIQTEPKRGKRWGLMK